LESEYLIVGALCSTPFLIFGAFEYYARRRRRKERALATRTKRRPESDRDVARR
jgi:hypothetical protein